MIALIFLCALLLCFACVEVTSATSTIDASPQFVYFGTQSSNIYLSTFYPNNGSLTEPVPIAVGPAPTWIEMNANKTEILLVNENIGHIQAYKIDPVTGFLTNSINEVSNFGEATCHMLIDHSGRWIGAVNYGSGSFYLRDLSAEGALDPIPVFSYEGGIHPHQFLYSKDNRFVFVPDLGADKILQFEFDSNNLQQPMKPNQHAGFVSTTVGAGPRHLAFSPVFPNVVYGANELDSTLNVYSFDTQLGTLTLQQTLSTLPIDHISSNPNYPAEVVVSPKGDYVYISNRGNDTIATFAVEMTGSNAGYVKELYSLTSCEGSYPRFIGFDLSNRYMFAANQNSNNVAIFEVIDSEDSKVESSSRGDSLSRQSFKLISSVPLPSPQHAYFIPTK